MIGDLANPARTSSRPALSRFDSAKIEPARAYGLAVDHPAVVEGRTLFPGQVAGTWESPRFLVSGHNNPKLGKEVVKGPRAGWPIYQVSLEERATCPRSCAVWADCYGNAMPYARRHAPDEDFIPGMKAEVVTLARAHPKGLLIRLHTLGDFYSVAYVRMWERLLDFLPHLAVFGYTARREDADDAESRAIAKAVRELADKHWDRFSIRFSHAEAGQQRAIVVDADPRQADIIVCPAQLEVTAACATCGLCWTPAARSKTIAFLRHGMKKAAPSAGKKLKRQTNGSAQGSAGRKLVGGLPGEDYDGRARRVAAYAVANPQMTAGDIQHALGVPLNVALQGHVRAHRNGGPKLVFMPRQQFTPGPSMAATPEQRIAATPQTERERIAAAYGVTFKSKSETA